MKLVLDNNILFSLMNPLSTASYLFSSLKAEFLAPEFIKEELDKHKEECLLKAAISEEQFEIRQKEVEESIRFFKPSEYERFLARSKATIADSDDSDFLALALFMNVSIWSNDSHLKEQSLAHVFTTAELVSMFLKGEI